MRMRATALVGVVFVLASGCGVRLGAGTVDAARAACIEAARKKGDRPLETENVRSPGEGRHEMSVRNSVIGTFVDNLQRLRNGRALLALIDEQERS